MAFGKEYKKQTLSFPPPTKAFEGRRQRESIGSALWHCVMGSRLRGNECGGLLPTRKPGESKKLGAKAAPDGYTIFMPTVANAINASLKKHQEQSRNELCCVLGVQC